MKKDKPPSLDIDLIVADILGSIRMVRQDKEA
jgi:hypothetical protein